MRKVVVLLVISLLCGCETIDRTLDAIGRPTARLTGLGLDAIDLEGATLLMDVEVANPYSVPLPLLNLDYALASRSTPFLSGAADLQGVVPARGRKTVSLPARLQFRSLMDALSGVRPGSLVPYAADLGLGVDAPALGRLRLPMRKEGELPVPAPPEIQVQEIVWRSLSLDEVAGTMAVNIVNPNEFPFDLARLDYGLQLAGVEVARSSLARATSFAANGGRGTVEIPLSFSPAKLGLALLSAVSGAGASYQLAGDASLNTPFGPMTLPAGSSGNAPVRR